jgi:cell division protein FtsI/penicillin-binding protein 2
MKLSRKSYQRYESGTLDTPLNQQRNMSIRLLIFAGIMIFSMLAVFARFYYIQIIRSDYYAQRLELYSRRILQIAAPRGEMIDRNGNYITSNVEMLEITYMPPQRLDEATKMSLSKQFAENFEMNVALLRERDLKDLYLYLNPTALNSLLTQSERDDFANRVITSATRLERVLSRIDESMLESLTYQDKAMWLVKILIEQPTGGRPKVIKSNVSKEEVAYLVEHNSLYSGFDVRISWGRLFPYNETLRTVLGFISTPTQGVPQESLLYYLANDYLRNDIVGRAGIELQYESILRGISSVYNLKYRENGEGFLEVLNEGKQGDTVKLSFDIEWQQFAEETITRVFNESATNKSRRFMDVIDFVMMDVNTGDVLIMASVAKTEDGYIFDPMSTILNAYEVGSSIKGATVYIGLDQKVIRINEVILDQPIKIQNTPLKSSYRNLGYITDLKALSRSSNIYMFNIAMRLGGANYVYDGPLSIDTQAFTTMRNYYSQFGLGTHTQIDLPNEQTGFSSSSTLPGLLLDFSIGQYDTYTPIQLAQYVSTIANGGKRIAPRVFLESYDSQTGQVNYINPVRILNILDNQEAIKRVQDGFRDCVVNEICRSQFNTMRTPFAAKTGTAETSTVDEKNAWIRSHNNTIVTFGPFDNPQIATSCVARHAWVETSQSNICQIITAEILKFRYP